MSAGDGSFAGDVCCCLSHISFPAANPAAVTGLTRSNRNRPEIFSEKEKQRKQAREMDKKVASKSHCSKGHRRDKNKVTV